MYIQQTEISGQLWNDGITKTDRKQRIKRKKHRQEKKSNWQLNIQIEPESKKIRAEE